MCYNPYNEYHFHDIVRVCENMSELKYGLIYEVYAIPNAIRGVQNQSTKEMKWMRMINITSKARSNQKKKVKQQEKGRTDRGRPSLPLWFPHWYPIAGRLHCGW